MLMLCTQPEIACKIGAMERSSQQLTRQAGRSFFLTATQLDLEYSAVACIPNMPEFQKQRLLTLWRKQFGVLLALNAMVMSARFVKSFH